MPSGVSLGLSRTHGRALPPENTGGVGRRRSVRALPGNVFGVYRFDRSRALRAAFGRKPSARGVLTRF